MFNFIKTAMQKFRWSVHVLHCFWSIFLKIIATHLCRFPTSLKPNQKLVFHSYFFELVASMNGPISRSSFQLWLISQPFKWFSYYMHDIASAGSHFSSYFSMSLKYGVLQVSIFVPDLISFLRYKPTYSMHQLNYTTWLSKQDLFP